jgi:hypothetical protein
MQLKRPRIPRPKRSTLANLFRDVFLGGLALAILYEQVFEVAAAGKAVQPILIFLVIFLFGSIPALRGNSKSNQPSTFARVIMAIMGVSMPSDYAENEESSLPSGTGSSSNGPTPRRTSSAGQSSQPSSRSSKSSPSKDTHE